MNRARAVTLAIAALEREIKALAVQANLADVYHATTPACVQANARRKELRAAVAALGELEQQRLKL